MGRYQRWTKEADELAYGWRFGIMLKYGLLSKEEISNENWPKAIRKTTGLARPGLRLHGTINGYLKREEGHHPAEFPVRN
jgi:hypothetical protein